jgi:hypothetical protein
VKHLVTKSHVNRSTDEPRVFIETNLNATYILLQAARAYYAAQGRPKAFRFHHVSTADVFGSLVVIGRNAEDTAYARDINLKRMIRTILDRLRPIRRRSHLSATAPATICSTRSIPHASTLSWNWRKRCNGIWTTRYCGVHCRPVTV